MQRFENQVAIVTGAARGIGRAIGERLAQEGAQVVLVDLQKELLRETIAEFSEKGLQVFGQVMDITEESAVENGIKAVVNTHGRLDIMVNSAAIIGPTSTPITAYSYRDFRNTIDVNLHGTFLMTKYVLPYMEAQRYGRILLISSIGGKEGNPGMVGYAASKSGVIGLVKAVGKEYAAKGITVNGLAPAVIATPMNQQTDPKMLDYMAKKIPMGRLGTVDEAASIAAWIVSKEASFNTGVIFDLSGGRATF